MCARRRVEAATSRKCFAQFNTTFVGILSVADKVHNSIIVASRYCPYRLQAPILAVLNAD